LILTSCCKITSIEIEGGVMQKGSCQQEEGLLLLRVAASSNKSVNTDVLSAGFARRYPRKQLESALARLFLQLR